MASKRMPYVCKRWLLLLPKGTRNEGSALAFWRRLRGRQSKIYQMKSFRDTYAVVLGGLVGGPRAYQDQFRGHKSHRVHARRDFFLYEQMISGKREKVS